MPLLVSSTPLTARRTAVVTLILATTLCATLLLSLATGNASIPPGRVLGALFGNESISPAEHTIVVGIRLPRVLLAVLAGSALSVAGVALQALLRNPLAEPYILGISSGGTMGAVAALLLPAGLAVVTTPLASFAGALLVMGLVYWLAHRRGRLDTYALLLSGVMVGAFFNSMVLLIVGVFQQELRHAFLWLMGNLGGATPASLLVVGPPVIIAAAALMAQARDLNLIAMGDESALQLGVDVGRVKRRAYILASLITGLVVSLSGVIGFLGLIIPHLCRLLFGPDHRLLMPASFLAGALFLVLADLAARTLIAPAEIPVGAVTAALGAPLFVYLLRKT